VRRLGGRHQPDAHEIERLMNSAATALPRPHDGIRAADRPAVLEQDQQGR
jgi:hypothetical protein